MVTLLLMQILVVTGAPKFAVEAEEMLLDNERTRHSFYLCLGFMNTVIATRSSSVFIGR